MWGLSSSGCTGALASGILERVAVQELAAAERVLSYNTRELCSIIQACGVLALPSRSAAVAEYFAALVQVLVERMEVGRGGGAGCQVCWGLR